MSYRKSLGLALCCISIPCLLSAEMAVESTSVKGEKLNAVRKTAIVAVQTESQSNPFLIYLKKKKSIPRLLCSKMMLYFAYDLYTKELAKIGKFEILPAQAVEQNPAVAALPDKSKTFVYKGTKPVYNKKKQLIPLSSALNVDSLVAIRFSIFQRSTDSEGKKYSPIVIDFHMYDASGAIIVKSLYAENGRELIAFEDRVRKWEDDNKAVDIQINEYKFKNKFDSITVIENLVDAAATSGDSENTATKHEKNIAEMESRKRPEAEVFDAPDLATFIDPSYFTEEEYAQLLPWSHEIYW